MCWKFHLSSYPVLHCVPWHKVTTICFVTSSINTKIMAFHIAVYWLWMNRLKKNFACFWWIFFSFSVSCSKLNQLQFTLPFCSLLSCLSRIVLKMPIRSFFVLLGSSPPQPERTRIDKNAARIHLEVLLQRFFSKALPAFLVPFCGTIASSPCCTCTLWFVDSCLKSKWSALRWRFDSENTRW